MVPFLDWSFFIFISLYHSLTSSQHSIKHKNTHNPATMKVLGIVLLLLHNWTCAVVVATKATTVAAGTLSSSSPSSPSSPASSSYSSATTTTTTRNVGNSTSAPSTHLYKRDNFQMVHYSDAIMDRMREQEDSHFVSTFPNKERPLKDLQFNTVLAFGQNTFDQFFTTQMFNIIFDKFSGHRLPIDRISIPLKLDADMYRELHESLGTLYIEISNVRLHKTRITGYHGTNPNWAVQEDAFGGRLVPSERAMRKMKGKKGAATLVDYKITDDLRKANYKANKARPVDPAEQDDATSTMQGGDGDGNEEDVDEHGSSTGPTSDDHAGIVDDDGDGERPLDEQANPNVLVYIAEKNGRQIIRTAVKGLNLLMTADYKIIGMNGILEKFNIDSRGNMMTRIVDSVMFMDVVPSWDPASGAPEFRLADKKPELIFGKLDCWFDGADFDWLRTAGAKIATKYFQPLIANALTFGIGHELPAITKLTYYSIEHHITKSVNMYLDTKQLARPAFPHIVIEDLRMWLADYKLQTGCNIRYVSPEQQVKLKEEFERTKREKEQVSPDKRMEYMQNRIRHMQGSRVMQQLMEKFERENARGRK